MAVIPPFMDRSLFYAQVRPLFGGLKQSQVNGLERLLDVWAQFYAADPIEFLAYNLATSFHETAATMQPIKEDLNYSADGLRKTFKKYFTGVEAAEYARQPQRIANRAYANRNGNGSEASGDGWRFRGEGDVMNTGRANAARATRELNAAFNLGIDLVANPDLRGDPIISAHSLFLGNKEGWWTGKKLGDYIKPGNSIDFQNARYVVNGEDDAALIARYAETFLKAIIAAGGKPRAVQAPTPAAPVPVIPAFPTPDAPTAVSVQPFLAILSGVVSLFFRKPS